jgi:hypothetical protein
MFSKSKESGEWRVESGEGEARGGEYSGTEATLSEKERGQDGRWL